MRKVKLLPYIREDVFGLDTKTGSFTAGKYKNSKYRNIGNIVWEKI